MQSDTSLCSHRGDRSRLPRLPWPPRPVSLLGADHLHAEEQCVHARACGCVRVRAWGGGGLVVGQVTWPHVLFEFVRVRVYQLTSYGK